MLSLIRAAEWSHLRDYVSPAFVQVLPASALASETARWAANATRGKAFREALGALSHALDRRSPGVSVVEQASPAGLRLADLSPEQRTLAGQRVLELFFSIVLGPADKVLDLRPERFTFVDGKLHWAPGRLWTTWSASFGDSIGKLYRGFYGDDDARFDRALGALDLTPASGVMRRHFGGDDQRQVRFETATFHATFHEVFVTCRDAGVVLDPGFVSLGVLLGCLYQTLESLQGPFDVRAAFDAVEG